jgi:hypothetical protein
VDKVTRTNRQISNIQGTITSTDGLAVPVRFDLIEFEDLIDGMPGQKFSYGVLRFEEPLEPSIGQRLLAATHLLLSGGGVQAALCLYKLTSFTLVDTIKDFAVKPELIAA